MIYHIDTSAAVHVMRTRQRSVRERLAVARAQGDKLALSDIVLYELWSGVLKSGREQEEAERIRRFLSSDVEILAFEPEDAKIAAAIRADLERTGQPIGPYDLLIGAQALRAGATLVTGNVREFSRVPGLVWEDWTASTDP